MKTTTEKITDLKKQASDLKASTKASDKAQLKTINRKINALQSQKKNISTLSDLKMKNRSDIKEVADNQLKLNKN